MFFLYISNAYKHVANVLFFSKPTDSAQLTECSGTHNTNMIVWRWITMTYLLFVLLLPVIQLKGAMQHLFKIETACQWWQTRLLSLRHIFVHVNGVCQNVIVCVLQGFCLPYVCKKWEQPLYSSVIPNGSRPADLMLKNAFKISVMLSDCLTAAVTFYFNKNGTKFSKSVANLLFCRRHWK